MGVFIKALKIGEQRVRWVGEVDAYPHERLVKSSEAKRFASKAEADTLAQELAREYPGWTFHLFETAMADPGHPWKGRA